MRVVFNVAGQEANLSDEIIAAASAAASPMFDAGELSYLAAAVSLSPYRAGGFIIEIGTYIGSTAAFLGRVVSLLGRDTLICSIDPFEDFSPDSLNPQGSYTKYRERIRDLGLADRCFAVSGFSHMVAPSIASGADLVLIDGSHHYPDVVRDLQLFCPKVQPGGYIFIDDYSEEHYSGVVQAVKEFLSREPEYSTVHESYFSVLRRRS